MFTPAKTVAWQQLVAAAAIDALGGGHLAPSIRPWRVEFWVYAQIPASWPKAKRARALEGQEHPGKPDLDNVAKSILDACNGLVYVDDSQVIRISGSKGYDAVPRVEVYMHETS